MYEIQVDNRLKYLEMLRAKIKKQLSYKVDMKGIKINERNGHFYYYLRNNETPDGKRNSHYVKKSELSKVSKIAQREYNLKLLKAVESEIACLARLNGNINQVEHVYDQLGMGRQALVNPLVKTEKQRVEEWLSVEYPPGIFDESNTTKFYTSKGERVRSKSEALIANELINAGIPYRYEYPLNVNNKLIRPDFLIYDVRKDMEVVWEHLGMADNRSYSSYNLERLADYQVAGFIPNVNLFITVETRENPLSLKAVRNIIKSRFL